MPHQALLNKLYSLYLPIHLFSWFSLKQRLLRVVLRGCTSPWLPVASGTLQGVGWSNIPARRPEATALLDQVNTVLSALPQQFTNRVEMLQQFEAHVQSKQSLIDSKQSEIESLRAEVERLSVRSPSRQAHRQPNHTSRPDIQEQVHNSKSLTYN